MVVDTRGARLSRRIKQLYAEDQQIRAAKPFPEVGQAIRQPGLRLGRIVEIIAQAYADRPALGQRATERVVDEATGRKTLRLLPAFDTITYGQLWARVGAVSAVWHAAAERPVAIGDFVAILGFTSSDYTTLDLACIRSGVVSVPLQAGASTAALRAIMAETEPRVLAASAEQLDVATELAGPSVTQLIVFDYHPEDDAHREAYESARARLGDRLLVQTLDEVIDRGRTLPQPPSYAGAPQDDPLALLIYTSGSTGTPKGAMYTERLLGAVWLDKPDFSVIHLNYMPMSHIAGRMSLYGILARGGTAYFAARSDMSTLFEDFALVRPTEEFFVPRVCDLIFQRYQSELEQCGPGADTEAVKARLRHELFGDRLLGVTCGSAPLAAEMRTFVESVLDLDVHDGYGSTEAGAGILIDNQVRRPPVLDYKLADVPELGYFATDKPHPRGELLLKSATMIPGYYKRPEVTAEIFDPDGFYRTGDIVAELAPDRLVYVDRRNNVLKLSQGEFVTVANLEAIYAASPLVGQIFVYGSSERAYLLAVIVPTPEARAAHPDTAELKTAIGESLQQIAKDAQLHSYEIPRDFLLETEPFTTENGLLSGIGKILRPKLKEHYGERLQQRYAELAEEQANELLALRRTGAERPVLETVGRATSALLGCASTDLRPDAHFTELGGDSLSALSLSTLLQEIFDIEVPVGVIIGPAGDLRGLADYIEGRRASGAKRPSSATVHAGTSTIRAAELTLDKFIDARILAGATTIPAATGPIRTVMLTGANGYLGRFLCLEWLERLRGVGGRLICVVRGSDNLAAGKRLTAVFDSGDPELVRHFQELAHDTLEVLAGDISEPNLGLSDEDWQRLAETVDLIVHPAALVNHLLIYPHLFGPNVVGTAEIIRLALTARRKPVTYLSTVAVATGVEPGKFVEDGDIREVSPVRAVDNGYANGYANSKWAGEVLLRQAHDLCGLPVAVFRSDMILAHSTFGGQLNLPDMFTRLLLSVLATGIAPYSFYETDGDGQRQRAHYDGLPADFTAAAITTLGAAATEGFHSFDVLNPHDDGIGLDEFVDWLIEAGEPIQRIDDYQDWLSRFETALRALPERQRHQSLLPLLHAYRKPSPAVHGALLPAEVFHAAVRSAGIGPEHDIPHLNRRLITKYVRDLYLHHLL